MDRQEALEKADRVVRAVKEGKVPYRVLQVVLFGSAAKGAEKPNDVDIFVQVDPESVREEDLDAELFHGKGGIGEKLRKALKASKGERMNIHYDTTPWEQYRMHFTKPESLETTLRERVSDLDLSLESHRRAKSRLEKSTAKRREVPPEWPPFGLVLYQDSTAAGKIV